jgi:large subunit ribosomal protein L13
MKRETHTIDASGRILGRLASEIAILLRGKHKPDFQPNKDLGDFVVVKNVDKVRISGKKKKTKKYYRYSGFPGGLKEVTLEKIFDKNPAKIFKMAVLGMLPKNKLQKEQIKRLSFAK